MNTSSLPITNPIPTPSPAQNARALLKEFQTQFAVFRDYQPLAIGVDKQLIALFPEISRKVLRMALGIHTNSLRYLKVMEKATVRFDLEGNTADEITDTHRAYATEILKARFKKDADLRKAKRLAEEAEKAAAEAAQQRTEKLNQLAEKFSRN